MENRHKPPYAVGGDGFHTLNLGSNKQANQSNNNNSEEEHKNPDLL